MVPPFQPPVYALGRCTVQIGRDQPDGTSIKNLEAKPKSEAGQQTIKLMK